MSLRQCKRCFTMKNIKGKRLLCKKCEIEFDKEAEKIAETYNAKEVKHEDNKIKLRRKIDEKRSIVQIVTIKKGLCWN